MKIDLKQHLRSTRTFLAALLTNRFFWAGLGVLVLLLALLFLFFNNLILPAYTRHDVAVNVPDVRNMPYPEAERLLQQQDLYVEQVVQRFNPALPRDEVIDQNPRPNASVKPGRRIYLTVNTGTTPSVKVPRVTGLSRREAENRLLAARLKAGEVLPDTIPAPYPNTITRQSPAPGDSLPEGSGIKLWYSTGFGRDYVSVPDVTGLSVPEAEQVLLDNRLRSVVVGAGDEDAEAESLTVSRQSREAGARVREGFEIRLFVGEEEPVPDSEALEGVEEQEP